MTDECTCHGCTTDDLLIPQLEPAPPLLPDKPRGLDFWNETKSRQPRRIVAFTGLAGSGKSTAALHLVKSADYERVRFAGPLKAMMAALGLTHEEIEGHLKEKPCALLGGKTPRYAMQTIGTEWGRDIIARDLWIRAWSAAVDRLPVGVPVVVDDCRFENEAAAVLAAGGQIIRVVRPGAGAGAAGHSSEAEVGSLPATLEIQNDSTLAAFLERIDVAVRDLSWVGNTH